MNYQQFEGWLNQLSESDRKFLDRQTLWKKEYQAVKQNRSLPPGFAGKTMEILEGGSESET